MIISIIIPTYNRNKVLCDTINQILRQDYNDYELLIVDQSAFHDNHTDKFLSELPANTKLIKVNNPNLPASRNIGIQESSGEIIVFIDDDMSIPKNTLSKVTDTFNKNKEMMALTGFMKGTSTLAGYYHKKKLNNKYRNVDILKVKHFLGGFMCFRKNVFDKVGYFDEWIGTQPTASGEDLEFSLRLIRNGISLYLNKNIEIEHIGKSLIHGGYDKSSFSLKDNKFWQMKNNIYIQLKHKKPDNFIGSILALWIVYRGSIFNRSSIRRKLKEIISLHKKFFISIKEIKSVLRFKEKNLH